MKHKLLIGLMAITLGVQASANVMMDKTRIIFNESEKIATITVTSPDDNTPLLIQSWIEDEAGERLKETLVALPLLQRLDPGRSKQVKITAIGDTSMLPTDRESLFSFNLLEVPPKGEQGGGSGVKLVMQAKLKLFYRPKGITFELKEGWQEALRVQPVSGNTVLLQNPTPYHMVIMPVVAKGEKSKEILLKPFAEVNYQTSEKSLANVRLGYINDFGGIKLLTYQCGAGQCRLQPNA